MFLQRKEEHVRCIMVFIMVIGVLSHPSLCNLREANLYYIGPRGKVANSREDSRKNVNDWSLFKLFTKLLIKLPLTDSLIGFTGGVGVCVAQDFGMYSEVIGPVRIGSVLGYEIFK